MGTMTARKRKDGSVSYMARVRAMRDGATYHEPETFDRRPATRACKLLDIKDLRFHDMRHEGVSRLFEMGWNIPHVAAVSGHRSWVGLKRYTHIRETGDKYVGLARPSVGHRHQISSRPAC